MGELVPSAKGGLAQREGCAHHLDQVQKWGWGGATSSIPAPGWRQGESIMLPTFSGSHTESGAVVGYTENIIPQDGGR